MTAEEIAWKYAGNLSRTVVDAMANEKVWTAEEIKVRLDFFDKEPNPNAH